MPMQAATLHILVDKGHFELPVASAVAEAIDNEIQGGQFVTVSVLDSRLADMKGELKVEIRDAVGSLERRMYAAMLGQMTVLVGMLYFFAAHVIK